MHAKDMWEHSHQLMGAEDSRDRAYNNSTYVNT